MLKKLVRPVALVLSALATIGCGLLGLRIYWDSYFHGHPPAGYTEDQAFILVVAAIISFYACAFIATLANAEDAEQRERAEAFEEELIREAERRLRAR